MARPPKSPDRRRAKRWIVRVDADDDRQARANARAAGLGWSAYLRTIAVERRIVPPDPLLALVSAINRAGNLVNQQMPIAHGRGDIPPELRSADAELAAALRAVTLALSR